MRARISARTLVPSIAALGLAAVGLAVAAAPAGALAISPPHHPPPCAYPEKPAVQSSLSAVISSGAPGALAVVREGPCALHLSAGVGDLTTNAPVDPRGDFRAGSVTKAFVSTVVLQLASEGRINLDAPISTYLPGLLPFSTQPTVRQLLHMESGLYDYINDLPADTPADFQANREKTFTPTQLVDIATSHGQTATPGSTWAYSNTNFIVLGMLIEKMTGEPVATAFDQRIIQPLGLTHTEFPVTDTTIPWSHAEGYHPDGSSAMFDTTTINPSAWWTTGALISNGDDLNTFFRALLTGRLVSPGMLAQMETVTATGWSLVPNYGLGLIRRDLSCNVSVWGHSGIVEGYTVFSFSSADGTKQITVEADSSDNSALDTALENAVNTEFCGTAGSTAVAHDVNRYHM